MLRIWRRRGSSTKQLWLSTDGTACQAGDAVVPDAVLELATARLTPKQIEVWNLIYVEGYTQRACSYRLDLARTTVTDRLDAANRTLRRCGVRFTQDGTPYLEETA
jgi:DNA-directed RNA polymerase specialized sigma24 family protein